VGTYEGKWGKFGSIEKGKIKGGAITVVG